MNAVSRYENAIYISDGACNPSGIALSIVDACREARSEGKTEIEKDSAIKLMVSQFAYICGIWDGASEWSKGSFDIARRTCQYFKGDLQ